VITNPGAVTPVFLGVAKMTVEKKKKNIEDLEQDLTPEQVETMVDTFFEQMETKITKGRSWTFHRFCAACDTPGAERVQAVLYPNDDQGFALYARQGYTQHAVTYNRRPVRFRTMEKALTILADVGELEPEVIVDLSDWREEAGPF
jgi:hypothetical protein